MPRVDAHEPEFGPGIGLMRNGGAEAESYGMQDQRGSVASGVGFAMFSPSPRFQNEREYGGAGGGGMGIAGGREDWMRLNRRMAGFASSSYSSPSSPPLATSPPPSSAASRSCIWWGELEPWMDEEYAKQVCNLMRWEPVSIKIPPASPDTPHAMNPGYCLLTFPSPAHAASVLAQVSGSNMSMPNSSKPFVLNWASSVSTVSVPAAPISSFSQTIPSAPLPPATQQQYPKEYSIFVGDLAPETSNSDLVAVFRNPVLGLRNDREPKFIRPFTSCKSAKIMLDPVTGVSRGYGFVRFTDEADQQRALIEMHGLYCLSRPMRISPATAKYKPPAAVSNVDLPPVQFSQQNNGSNFDPQLQQPIALALPLSNANQAKNMPTPIAITPSSTSNTSVPSSASASSMGASSQSANSLSSNATSQSSASSAPSPFSLNSSEDILSLPNSVLAQIAQQYANGSTQIVKPSTGMSITAPFAQDSQQQAPGTGNGAAPRYMVSEESWKHHAQARAILGNLIGPNGEQLTSTDPYNTTVFVGGLSPLISEETLRTFFAPFGDIHYVKVPVGKHCGFVQFVRKADAERAIEKMQGFPVGGSRIRLSWGRSQYKAAQAAAQAAQTAALQSHFATNAAPTPAAFLNNRSTGSPLNAEQAGAPFGQSSLTQEQAMQLLQKLSLQGYLNAQGGDNLPNRINNGVANGGVFNNEDKLRSAMLANNDEGPLPFEAYYAAFGDRSPSNHLSPDASSQSAQSLGTQRPRHQIPAFSPFSPEPTIFNNVGQPNAFSAQNIYNAPPPFSATGQSIHGKRRDSAAMLSVPPGAYGGGSPFYPQAVDINMSRDGSGPSSRMSPNNTRPSSAATRYGPFLDGSPFAGPINKAPGSAGATPISRPSSGNRVKPEYDDHGTQEHDLIQDLNGTLASLDLDHQATPQSNRGDKGWKKETEAADELFTRQKTDPNCVPSP